MKTNCIKCRERIEVKESAQAICVPCPICNKKFWYATSFDGAIELVEKNKYNRMHKDPYADIWFIYQDWEL